MEKRPLGNTGLLVTPLGFGVLTIGPSQLNLPVAEGAALLRYALEQGINFLDTAQYYRTYPYIKEALKGFSGDPVIVSKSFESSAGAMKEAVEEARTELDRDVIDLFLLHEVRGPEDFYERAGAWDYLLSAKEKGLIRGCGVSTHHVDMALHAPSVPGMDALFPLINFKGLGIRKGEGEGTKEEMAVAIRKAAEAGIGVFSMKVFGGGNLAGSYQEAVRYVMELPGITSIMTGFGKAEEVDRMMEMMEGTLAPDYVPDLSEKRIFIDQGDCEGCGACKNKCPNGAIFWNENGLAQVDPKICLTCGYCAPVCPVRAIILIG